MVDLAFRDESSAVIEKAKAKARARKELRSSSSSALKRPSSKSRLLGAGSPEPSVISSASSSIISFPSSSIEDRGINCFLNNWVSKGGGPSHGYFNYCHELLAEDTIGSVLQTSIIASGLAIEANKNRDSQLLFLARYNYALALSKINSALRSPTEAVKDSVLLSIIVVAVFEVCCGSHKLSMKAWTEHINGASTLIRMRGRSQLRNEISRGVFIYGTSHLLLSCMQREIPMHPEILELRKEAFSLVPSDPGWEFLKKSDECTVFRGAIKSGDLTDPAIIISTALRLDNDMTQVFDDAPLSWMYETVYTDSNSPFVFSGAYDIYYDIWGSRCVRIGLNEIIRTQLIKGFASNRSFNTLENFAQFQASTQIITQMRDEILRSVPQHVGLVPRSRKPFQNTPFHSNTRAPPPLQNFSSNFGFSLDNLARNPETSPLSFADLLSDLDFASFSPLSETLELDPSFPAIGSSFLLWPLYVAAITRVSQQEHRIFVSNVLTYIGENRGIRQASNIASFLQGHPAFQRMETGKCKGSGVMAEIDEWKKSPEAPIQHLREMFMREEKEAELVRAAGEELMRNYGEGERKDQPEFAVENMYKY